jgi:hypothetical protein
MENNSPERIVEVYPGLAKCRYYAEHFKQRENDTTLDKPYSDGGFEVWFIHEEAPPGTASP